MPLKIGNITQDVPRLNKWADFVESRIERIEALQREHAKSVKNLKTATASVLTLPFSPTSVSASESGYIIDGVLYSEVTATYTAPNPQGTFAGVYLVIKGYRGSTQLVKIAEHTFTGVGGGSASFKVTLQRTGETVTLYFVPKNANEASPTPWSAAPSTTVILDGNASAPNAPTGVVASATASGNSLAWNENAELNMMSYNVYRNTSNLFAGATKIANVAFTGSGAPSYLDTTAVAGTTYFYFITAVNTALQESGAATVASVGTTNASIQGMAAAKSSLLTPQGSVVGMSSNPFSYTSTTTSITWSWSAFTIYFADGTTQAITGSATQGTQTFSGLSASNTYYFVAYVTVANGLVTILKSANSSGTSPAGIAQTSTANLDGRAPISVNFTGNTPASGSGGGGSGGGSGICFSPNTKVITQRGNIPILRVEVGDMVLTATGEWRKVIFVTTRLYDGEMLDMGNGELVEPHHRFLKDTGWLPAKHLGFPPVRYSGSIHNLHIDTDVDDDGSVPNTQHSYTLTNGWVVHNLIT